MRKASLPKLDKGEITPGATAAAWFVQVWAQLRGIVEPLARDALRADDDGELHTLTLEPAVGDAPTAVVLQLAAIPTSPPTTPTPAPVATANAQGDWKARSYDTTALAGVYKVNGVQVVKARQTLAAPTYSTPTGGTTTDSQARASLAQLATDLAALRAAIQAHGLTT